MKLTIELTRDELRALLVGTIPVNLPPEEYKHGADLKCTKCRVAWARIRWKGILHCGSCFEELVREPLVKRLSLLLPKKRLAARKKTGHAI